MNEELRHQILNEATRIGDELLSLLRLGEEGMPGNAISGNSNRNIIHHKTEIIYDGISGFVLFLLELFKQTEDEKYLTAAVEGMRWIERYCQNKSTDNYAFITGRMGVPYTMMRMFNVTKESDYLEKALKIARPCLNFLNSAQAVSDYVSGTSGIVLVLLHLHALTGEKWILETIDAFIRYLLDGAYHGLRGLYWDRSPKNISGLCGFAHGASGIGYVFLELGHYFQDKSFNWIAEQAFLYESQFYDKKIKNWLDLRKDISNADDYERYKNTYLKGNLDFLTKGSDMNAWCHGAAGIGLSRLRAFELLGNPVYLDEMKDAVEKTKRTDIDSQGEDDQHFSFSLCHGNCGNAELFLEAYKTFFDERYLIYSESIAKKVLNSKDIYSSLSSPFIKTSLFLGNAGIGYYYLRFLEPSKVPSILLPKLEPNLSCKKNVLKYPGITASMSGMKQKVISKIFKRTLWVAESLIPKKLKNYFETNLPGERTSQIEKFASFVKNEIKILPPHDQAFVSEVFNLELEKWKMDTTIRSNVLLNIKEDIHLIEARRLVKEDDDSFLALELILNQEIKIVLTKWNWSSDSPGDWINNRKKSREGHPLLLKPTPMGISEKYLSSFTHLILTAFQNSRRVKSVLQEIINAFETDSSEHKGTILKTAIHQIKEAILAGVLVPIRKS